MRPWRRALLVLACASSAACERAPVSPTIGFTYNWGDTALESFVQLVVDSMAGAREQPIAIESYTDGGWAAHGGSPMAAEVRRATLLGTDPNVLVVIGPGGSREVLQVAPVYAELGVPVLVPTATSQLLDSSGAHLFRMVPNDAVQGAFIAAFADSALGARSIAVYHVPDEYGIGLAAGISGTARERGLTVLDLSAIRLVQPCSDDAGARYYADLVLGLAQRGTPDAVALAVRTQEAACFVRALRARWPALPIILGDGTYLDAAFLQVAGPAAEGSYLVAFWHPALDREASRRFVAAYTQHAGRAPRHGDAVFVDAAMLAATAIRDGAGTRAEIQRYLESLGRTRPAYEGITGAISFEGGAVRRLYMTRVRGAGSDLVVAQ